MRIRRVDAHEELRMLLPAHGKVATAFGAMLKMPADDFPKFAMEGIIKRIFDHASVFLAVHDCSSSFSGNTIARTVEIITVRITDLVPSESSPIYGSLKAI